MKTYLTSKLSRHALLGVVAGQIVQTPVRRLKWLEPIVGQPVWAKLENQQISGSFKYRGATCALADHPRSIPVIAASAGNHGLAVAEVAMAKGIPVSICLPTTASRLKRERIIGTGAAVIEEGSSLDQAITFAMDLAVQKGWRFISPYNDMDVIAGNASLFYELEAQVPDLQHIIVPVGGGGLIAGIALAAKSVNARVRIWGVEPARYASVSSNLHSTEIRRLPHRPTLADGLAVNLDPNTVTIEIIRELVAGITLLDEEDLAAGTLALMNHESLLSEPSGAAGIGAVLKLAREGKITGAVALPLCGGNLHRDTLSRILHFPIESPLWQSLLDLKGRTLEQMPVVRSYRKDSGAKARLDGGSPYLDLCEQMGHVRERLARATDEMAEFLLYCQQHGLVIEDAVMRDQLLRIKGAEQNLRDWQDSVDARTFNPDHRIRAEQLIRAGLCLVSTAKQLAEWRAPSYSQAMVPQFFNVNAQDNPGVNYDRYEHTEIRSLENQFLEILDVSGHEFDATVTSSGMAAYTIIEGFLLRHALRPGDTILTLPYIYFEASEQLSSLPCVQVHRTESYGVDEIMEKVAALRPRALFVDPLANDPHQRLCNLPALFDRLRATGMADPLYVIVDGTMIPAGLTAEHLRSTEHLRIIYYESLSKYQQLGLEMTLAGVVVFPIEYKPTFDRQRRNTGAALSRTQAQLFPVVTREQLRRRMSRISRNAVRFVARMKCQVDLSELLNVHFAGDDRHPDYAMHGVYPHLGGIITFSFKHTGYNHSFNLKGLIERIVLVCGQQGQQLTNGVSFGYTAPRISAASALAEADVPFLRLYIGDITDAEVDRLADIVSGGFAYALGN